MSIDTKFIKTLVALLIILIGTVVLIFVYTKVKSEYNINLYKTEYIEYCAKLNNGYNPYDNAKELFKYCTSLPNTSVSECVKASETLMNVSEMKMSNEVANLYLTDKCTLKDISLQKVSNE